MFKYFFYKIRDIMPLSCLNMLYFSLVHCHSLYNVEVYRNTSKTVLNTLCILNNKLFRILSKAKLDSPVKCFYTFRNVLPIPLLHKLQLLTFVQKCLYHKHLLPGIFNNYFIGSRLAILYCSKKQLNLYINSATSSYGQRNTVFKCSQLWNELPNNLKSFLYPQIFKKNIKQLLLTQM